jgi:hypothetical protein
VAQSMMAMVAASRGAVRGRTMVAGRVVPDMGPKRAGWRYKADFRQHERGP